MESKFYLAFALVVLRTKPKDVTVDDYIRALRKSLEEPSGHSTNLLDCSLFWRELFLKTQTKYQNLRDQYVFRENGNGQYGAFPTVNTPWKKRKTDPMFEADDHQRANISLKRRRLEDCIFDADLEEPLQTVEQDKDRTSLLSVLFQLARTPHQRCATNCKFAKTVQSACRVMGRVLEESLSTNCAARTKISQKPTLHEVCIAVKRLWSVIVAKLRNNSSENSTTVCCTRVALPTAAFMKSLLSALHRHCYKEALRKRDASDQPKPQQVSTGSTENMDEVFKHNCEALASVLCSAMALTTTLQYNQPDMFDAISSVFLQHIGHYVSLHVFSESDGEDLEFRIAQPVAFTNASNQNIDHTLLVSKAEANYLIRILRAFMYVPATDPLILGLGREATRTRAASVSADVRTKLQSTLLEAVFDIGAQSASTPDILALNAVTEHEEDLEPNIDDGDWFLSQVWNDLGWDILMTQESSPTDKSSQIQDIFRA